MPLSEKALLERDAKRDIGAELLQSVQEMMRGESNEVLSSATVRQGVSLQNYL
jgi:hypothetical protein